MCEEYCLFKTDSCQDATEQFKKYHPLSYLKDYIDQSSVLGPIDPKSLGQLRNLQEEVAKTPSETYTSPGISHVSLCVQTPDFETAAKAVLPHKSYIYASGSANTGASLKGNLDDWGRINFRPRVMRSVGEVDTRRKIFGHDSQYPFYVSPMGTIGAIHDEAEPAMVRGAVRKGAHMVVSTASTKSADQIMQSYVDEQARLKNGSPTKLFYQYYMPVDRTKAIELMHLVKKAG